MPKKGTAGKYEAIYARQSVDKRDSVSIETQIDECKKHCSSKEPRKYKDKGYSGKNTDRPDLTRLISDIQAGIISKVIVYKLDRISRNIIDFYRLYEIMEANGCDFVSHSENFDTTTSMGRAMMGVLVVFAQMERENTVARVKDNYDFRIKTGSWATGKAPFGFKNGKNEQGVKTLLPTENLEIVKWMFMTYACSPTISLGQIQSILIEKGFKGKQSNEGLSRSTIGHILTNPIYCAADSLLYEYYESKLLNFVNEKELWDGTVSAAIVGLKGKSIAQADRANVRIYLTNVTPVIDSKIFIAVQKRLSENSQIAGDNRPTHALQELSGLLKCADCGSAIKMQARPTLTCTGRGQRKICTNSFAGLKLSSIQEQVAVAVQERLDDMRSYRKTQSERRTAIRNEIAVLEKKLDNLIDLAATSDGVSDVVKSRIDALIVEINEKKVQVNTDDAEDTLFFRLTDDSNIQLAQFGLINSDGTFLFKYADLPVERKQTVLRILVKRVLLHTDGTVSIDWKI